MIRSGEDSAEVGSFLVPPTVRSHLEHWGIEADEEVIISVKYTVMDEISAV